MCLHSASHVDGRLSVCDPVIPYIQLATIKACKRAEAMVLNEMRGYSHAYEVATGDTQIKQIGGQPIRTSSI